MINERLCVFHFPESWEFPFASPEILNYIVSVPERYDCFVFNFVIKDLCDSKGISGHLVCAYRFGKVANRKSSSCVPHEQACLVHVSVHGNVPAYWLASFASHNPEVEEKPFLPHPNQCFIAVQPFCKSMDRFCQGLAKFLKPIQNSLVRLHKNFLDFLCPYSRSFEA